MSEARSVTGQLTGISISNYMSITVKAPGSNAHVVVGELESWSGFQEESNIVEIRQFNKSHALKLVGSSNVAAVELTCTMNPQDKGQLELAKAAKAKTPAEVIVKYWTDNSKTTGTQRTFSGIVASVSESGEFDAQRTCTYSVAVSGPLGEPVQAVVDPT
ncbi:hypothetical protein [Edwardsiella tarda]|uniref:hypothetical protein n=1 Tax=Edwardsiella tarda TaxID=636 RepID=UPI00083B2467|nr:hypothetical protein [Edwardsiella tarda]